MTPEPVIEPRQLDLFVDGRDAVLVHEVLASLVARDPDHTVIQLARLRDEHPTHPDLAALTLLADSLRRLPIGPATQASLMASIETMERELVPAARRLLGTESATFLRPLWRTLAGSATGRPFNDRSPRAHAGWLCQQYEDWAAVRAAIEAERDWAETPILRSWMGLARHHLGEPEAAIRLWLSLGWMDPALLARHAPVLPSAVIREGWETFERLSAFDELLAETFAAAPAASWFPAWLLLRHRGLAHLFRADEIPDTGIPTRVFSTLVELVPLEGRGLSDEVIAGRRSLRQLSSGFFRLYMKSMS